MTLRVLIVDDEPLARQRIRDLLAEEAGLEVVAECGDGEEAVERILVDRPDLVCLDVQMPEMTGFEVLEAVSADAVPAVIFVTAYDEYALRAFDANALDYLMKPFHRARFQAALERARRAVEARGSGAIAAGMEARLRGLLAQLDPRPHYARRLVVRIGSRIRFVDVSEVDYVDAEGNYARLHVAKRAYLLRETMARLEERLDPERFIRIHRSTIVNLDRIREIEPLPKGNYQVVLRDGTRLGTTRRYRENLNALIEGG